MTLNQLNTDCFRSATPESCFHSSELMKRMYASTSWLFSDRLSISKNVSLAVLIFIFLGLNVTNAQVTSDYDKNADFTSYKTYTFKGWAKGSDSQLNDLDKRRVEQAFQEELSARGLNFSDQNPDLAITLFLVVDEKTSTTAYTNYTGGMGYGYGWGWGMGMGSATTTYSQNDYQEGTLVIDFYDDNTKQLVWQGTIKKTLSNPKKRDKSIPKSVGKLMKKYPVAPVE